MEKLHYNLSEEEFSKGRKILLWIFAGVFFLGGIYVLAQSVIFDRVSIPPTLSIAPFGISLIVSLTALLATIKRKDLFFLVNDEKIEFRYGIINPKLKSFLWDDIKELTMPQKQRKIKIIFKDGASFIINLLWLQKKKSNIIRKHIYYTAKDKSLTVNKIMGSI